VSAKPGPSSNPESLLVVRLGAMGDVVHTLDAVTALRSALPSTRIGWIIEERWAELLCAKGEPRAGSRTPSHPLVDVVHSVDTKHWRRSLLSRETQRQISATLEDVRKHKYEVVVDFQGALKSAVIARCARASITFGMRNPREAPARMFYKRQIETRGAHVIEQYHSLAESVVGTPLPMTCPAFPNDSQAEQTIAGRLADFADNLVLISPGAGWAAKEWPPERYGEVASALAKAGFVSLVNFGPGEEPLSEAVRKSSSGAAQPVSCSIGELIALIRRARLFIGGDTGPLHLAAALRVPVVAIFGPTDPARNGPYGTKSIVLRHPASRTSLSHTRDRDPGLLNITSAQVIAAAGELLGTTIA
jgi:heptosyltransferase-1